MSQTKAELINAKGDAAFDTNTLFVDSTNNRVGIGTSTPGALLTLAASVPELRLVDSDNSLYGTITAPGGDIYIDADKGNGAGGSIIRFAVDDSEAARIDSSGRLLVGTSSARTNVRFNTDNKTPTVQFETAQNDYVGLSVINNSNAGFPANIWIGSTNGTSAGSNGLVGGQTIGNINFVGADGTNLLHAARIHVDTDGTTGSGDMPCRLVFSVTQDGSASPTERMRIANAGTCAHFATNDTVLGGNSSASSGNTVRIFSGSYNATAVFTGTESIRIWSSGDINNQNNSYTGISDLKLKENIADAKSQWDDIKQLRVRNYNLKTGSTHKQIGLVAQEVEPICPGLVIESPDLGADGQVTGETTKSVNYSVLYMKAVKALQEAMERIEVLEQRLTDAGIA